MDNQLNLFGKNINKEEDEFNKAKKEMMDLKKQIKHHSDLYYNQDKPEISDYEYDMLMNRLKDLEKEFPSLLTKNSPTQVVGGKARSTFEEVKHNVQMLSLSDVFSYEEVEEYVNKMILEFGENTEFVVETKIDGLSVSLEYIDGILVRGSTRGNGILGEDITENLLMLDEIKKELNEKVTIEVRGEVYLSKANLERLNEDLEKAGKPLLANTRNAAAGTLRQLDVDLIKKRDLSIFVFNVQKSEKRFSTHRESLDYCKKVGITTIAYSKIAKGVDDVLNCIKEIKDMRENLPYDIDGAVVKINDLSLREELGQTVKVPKWAVAYKYPPEEKETRVEDIKVQVGRTGQITPLAIVTPVKVAGSVISKCTLHNFDYIQDRDIRIGDIVRIRKAGDVIPEVAKVIKEKRTGKEIKYEIPSLCPVCGEILEKLEDEVALRCTNSECEAQIYRAIIHFASRDAMNIDGMGEAVVEQLISKNKITDVSDIYALKYENIYDLEGFKDKSINNLLLAIQQSKQNSLERLLFGLGIRHIGKKAAKVISENINDIHDLEKISVEQLSSIKDIGNIMAEGVIEFFSKEKTKNIVSKLEKSGVNILGNKKKISSKKLEGNTFVITGSFEKYSREELQSIIEENSGIVSGSVSKKTTYVISGENAGSKITKAKELGIKVLTLDEFIDLI